MTHSEDELQLILEESAKAARISPVSQKIATNAFEIRRRLVREVVYLDISLSLCDNLQRAKEARHTRFPLCMRVGEQLRINGYIVTVEQADDRRVQQLRFRRP